MYHKPEHFSMIIPGKEKKKTIVIIPDSNHIAGSTTICMSNRKSSNHFDQQILVLVPEYMVLELELPKNVQ